MKKIISLALILIMCLGVLTACNPIDSIKGLFGIGDKYDLDAAKTYLKQIYIDYLKDSTTDTSFDLVTTLDINGDKYSVAWASNNKDITLTPSEDGSKITVSFEKGDAEVEYTLTATITAPDGSTIDYALNLIIPKSNVIPIADALKADDGTKVTVKGTVIDIGTAWDDGYKNISVTIKDENGDKLYLYRLKTKVELGDIIIATGEMATYNNARQMAAGGTAEIKGKDSSFVVVEAKEYTIPDALKLEDNTPVIVKGTVTKINTAWDDTYGNISVTISDADGNTLYVHRLKTKVVLGDIITVTGKMTTYNEARQINAGATAEITGHDDSIVDAGGTTTDENGKITLSVADYATTNSWANGTLYSTIRLNDYVEIVVSGTAVGSYGLNSGKFYNGNNTWRVYANETPSIKFNTAEGTTIVSIKVTYTVPSGSNANKAGVLTLNGTNVASDEVVTINAATADFSVGNTTETSGNIQITAFEVEYTKGTATLPDSGSTTPDTGDGDGDGDGTGTETPVESNYEIVEAPVVDTAYKFGMVQKNKNNTVYYLVGGMNGYYMDSTDSFTAALDVYLEETDGGYYLYCMVDDVKTYINCVVSGTHVNGAYQTTASTVWTWKEDSKTVVATIDGAEYWLGTRNDNTYTTIGPCNISYNGFYCQFYAEKKTLN